MTDTTTTRISGNVLLGLLATTIFLVPVAPVELHDVLFSLLYSAVFVIAAMAMERHRGLMLGLAVVVTALEWVAGSLDLRVVSTISQALNTVFFVIVALRLVVQIARTKKVTLQVIVAAVNGYLLLGTIASIVVGLIALYEPAAYNFPPLAEGIPEDASRFGEYLYYGIVTFTTVGDGDVVPKLPYTRSLAIFTGVVGQMYVAIIIAMLVGKYAGNGGVEP